MAACILDYDVSLELVLDECVYTQARLRAYAYTAPLATDFDAFQTQWLGVNAEEIGIRVDRNTALAITTATDDDLNDLSDAASKLLLVITKNDRHHPQYVLYFGSKTASEFKRPQLGTQLESMRSWPGMMAKTSSPGLIDLGIQISTAVDRADKAVFGLTSADQNNRVFRTVGNRRQLIDSFNALRKSTYGKLAEMPHAQPALNLAGSFADRFFRAERSAPPAKVLTVAELEAQLQAAQKQAADLQAQLDAAKQAEAEAAAARAKEQANTDALALAELQAQIEALQTKASAIQARARG